MLKLCGICGEQFETTRSDKKYCSPDCAYEAKKRSTLKTYHEHRDYYRQRYKERRETEAQRKRSLDETVAAADAAGMTYGKYILMQRKKAGEI